MRSNWSTTPIRSPPVALTPTRRLISFYLRLKPDALIVRSIGWLQALSELGDVPPLYGDFALNATNTLSSSHFLSSGLARLTPGHDLNAEQLCSLARSIGPSAASQLEFIVHSHLTLFHTEHCVFARMLSGGSSIKDCGQPCERHSVSLRAPSGELHAVLADAGCRNTVFNGSAQSGAEFVDSFVAAGVGGLRVELLAESGAAHIAQLLEAYRSLAAPQTSPSERAAALGFLSSVPGGVTRGSLESRTERSRADMKPAAASLRS